MNPDPPFVIIIEILLTYQEYGIGKHQLSVFPEASEQHIIRKIGDRAVTHVLHSKQQPILQMLLQPGTHKS